MKRSPDRKCPLILGTNMAPQVELATSEQSLLNFVRSDNLLPEFGGSYAYDHQEWMSFRKVCPMLRAIFLVPPGTFSCKWSIFAHVHIGVVYMEQ